MTIRRPFHFVALLLVMGMLSACNVVSDTATSVVDATKSVVGAGASTVADPDGWVTAQGSFVGDSDHATSGTGFISRNADGDWVVTLGDDFLHDGAPDPKVALGRDGFNEDSILGELQSLNGRQTYVIPGSLDVADYNQIWIWCEKFSVPLGHADLTLR